MTVYLLTAAALQEVEAAVAYYESCEHGLGKCFAVQLQQSLQYITVYPHAWPEVRKGIRRYIVTRFPYAVLYYIDNDTIVVIAVMHSKRKPSYWADRIK